MPASASPSTRGGVYDRFRGRIMIPIRDASGRPIGFGGRIMPDAEGPKYLNSPATPLFDKSRTLYAIDLAKGAIRREKLAVIVEGYTDVMAAHQAGFENVVASLGTALTAGQVELANRYADGVALAYDVDLAGEAATQRGLVEELQGVVSKVRVIRIPAGKDPDEYIQTDPDGWREAVASAVELLPYFMERAAAEVDLRQAQGRSAYTRRMLDLLRRIPDRVEQDSYVPQLSRLAGIDERILRDELTRGPAPMPIRPADDGRRADDEPELGPLEREALTLLLLNPTLLDEVPADEPLPIRDAAGSRARCGMAIGGPGGRRASGHRDVGRPAGRGNRGAGPQPAGNGPDARAAAGCRIRPRGAARLPAAPACHGHRGAHERPAGIDPGQRRGRRHNRHSKPGAAVPGADTGA